MLINRINVIINVLYILQKFRFYAKNNWQKVCIYAKKSVPLYWVKKGGDSPNVELIISLIIMLTISLTEQDCRTIVIALGNAICARQDLARKSAAAAESGVETVYTQQEWIELAKKAKQEEAVFSELRGRIFREMNF